MKRPRSQLFVERDIYRRRRLLDAARVLPVLGFLLLLLPVLWARTGAMGIAGETIYVFVLWALLIVATALLSRALASNRPREVRKDRLPVSGPLAQGGQAPSHSASREPVTPEHGSDT